MKKQLFPFVIIGTLAASSPVHAAFEQAGLYAGFGLGYSELPYGVEDFPNAKGANVKAKAIDGFGQHVFIGGNLRQFAALEVGYHNYAPINATLADPHTNGQSAVTVKQQGINAALVLRTTDMQGFALFGKIGGQYNLATLNAASSKMEPTAHRADYWSVLYGAGISYAANECLSAQFQWQQTPRQNQVSTNLAGQKYNASLTNLYTVGLTYKF